MEKELKIGILERALDVAQITVERAADGKRTLKMSASSEYPVKRWFGNETLSHEPAAVVMERFKRGAVPLLWNHDMDQVLGMVPVGRLADKRLMVEALMFTTPRALEVGDMIDGGLHNVSIRYQPLEITTKQGSEDYTVSRWEPMEVSIVSVPADPTVGIGRAVDDAIPTPVRMLDVSQPAASAATTTERKQMEVLEQPAAGAKPQVPHASVTQNAREGEAAQFDPSKAEGERNSTIMKYARLNDISDPATIRHWIDSGKDWNAIADDILKIREQRSKSMPEMIGMSKKEVDRFSIRKVILAVTDPSNGWARAGFEAEVCKATAEQLLSRGKVLDHGPGHIAFPSDLLLNRGLAMSGFPTVRVLQVGTAAQGGYLVGTDNQPGSFIEVLRNRTVVTRLGARTLGGLMGNITIPKQLTPGTGYWLGELGTTTESAYTVGQIAMSPKNVGGYMTFSRQLLMQSSPDAEGLANTDLANVLALALDSAALAGTSTDASVPLGIRFQSGLGTANPTSGGGTASGTNVDYKDMIRFQSTVASSNALFPAFGYVCHPAVSAIMMAKSRFPNTDTPVWDGNVLEGRMVGAPAIASLQITSGTMLGGDFSQVLIGEWGTVEIMQNPYANFPAGIVGVRAFLSADIAVRYAQAFAIGTGITG